MGLRHLYRLLMHSQRNTEQSHRSEAMASSSDPRASAMHSNDLVADTSQAETTLPQATEEGPPNHEPQPSNCSTGKQRETADAFPPQIRADQRRYGQSFQNPDGEAIGMPPSEESTPTTNHTASAKALFPPLPPFRMRKRSCGGA